MKNLNLLTLLFLSLFSLSLTSCDKDDDEDVSPNISFLTGGEWLGDAIYVNGQNRTAEFEAQIEAESGAPFDWGLYTTIFNRDGSYVEAYDGDEIIEGTWEFSDDERRIIFDEGTSDEYEVVVSRLDEDELWYIQNGAEFRFER